MVSSKKFFLIIQLRMTYGNLAFPKATGIQLSDDFSHTPPPASFPSDN